MRCRWEMRCKGAKWPTCFDTLDLEINMDETRVDVASDADVKRQIPRDQVKTDGRMRQIRQRERTVMNEEYQPTLSLNTSYLTAIAR
jgi:hypothetical protein